jgi:hypothetical protein
MFFFQKLRNSFISLKRDKKLNMHSNIFQKINYFIVLIRIYLFFTDLRTPLLHFASEYYVSAHEGEAMEVHRSR